MSFNEKSVSVLLDGVLQNMVGECSVESFFQLGEKWSEMCVEHPNGASLICLCSSDRSVLVYTPCDEHCGYSSRAAEGDGDKEILRFVLSNGQVDEYPRDMTVQRGVASRAVQYFIETGTRSHCVQWHDDSV